MQEEEPTPRLPKPEDTEAHDRSHFEDILSPRDITSEKVDPSEPSPLLTSRRVAGFDEVELEGDAARQGDEADMEQRGRTMAESSKNDSDRSGSRASSTVRPTSNSSTPNISFSSWSSTAKQAPAAMTRKFSSPFGWLSRKKPMSGSLSESPPVGMPRRHTATGGSINGKPDFMLSRLDEDRVTETKLTGGESLRERFKLVRMREEAGVDIDSLAPESSSANVFGKEITNGLGIETSVSNSDNPPSIVTSPVTENGSKAPSVKTRSGSIASTVDPNLPPGTVAGMLTGPTNQDSESHVDWDLWQSVVYEGPSAVAKTSPAELTAAIANGIPSAIRGVVWQVLAHSKNDDLESVYRDLVNRGTEKETSTSSAPSGLTIPESKSAPPSAVAHTFKESSVATVPTTSSESMSTATADGNGLVSPNSITPSIESDTTSTQSGTLSLAERQKKTKEEFANIKKLEKTIRKDLGNRSNYSKYAVAAGLQEALFGVCKAYALFDEAVGYAQGMNFIVMPLLFNMPEEEAFCLLVRLMNQYRLRELFVQDMPGLHLHLYQFERILEDLEPALCYHLHKRQVVPSLYATPWFLTLFAYRFPLQLVLRVYDLVLSEGLEGAILKFAIAIMQKNAKSLIALQDMSALKTFLNEKIFDVYVDSTPSASSILDSGFFGSSGDADKIVYKADELIRDACSVILTPETIKQYTEDYENRTKMEKEREAEFDGLRTANAGLAAKIRILEERAQKSDTDHVQIATEMVKHKMENEDLKKQNEELLEQVAELRKIVAAQPDEVEKRLKDEMERIITRNSEVQNENRALEEQMTDMEKDLVETKLQYAQVCNHCPSIYRVLTPCLDKFGSRQLEAEMGRPTTCAGWLTTKDQRRETPIHHVYVRNRTSLGATAMPCILEHYAGGL